MATARSTTRWIPRWWTRSSPSPRSAPATVPWTSAAAPASCSSAWPSARAAAGLGVDLAAAQIEEARRRAAARAPGAQLEFRAADAGTVEGEFALSACVGSTHALGGLDEALDRMAPAHAARRPCAARRRLLGARADRRVPPGARRGHPRRAARLRRPRPRGRAPRADRRARPGGERGGLGPLRVDADRQRRALPGRPSRRARRPDDLRAWVARARDRITAPGGRGTMGFALVLLRR